MRAPPPVRAMPLSMISLLSSGGVLSRTAQTFSASNLNGSERASRTSSLVMVTVFGSPATRSRPRTSMVSSSSSL